MTTPTVKITTFGYLHGDPPPADLTVDLREHFRDPHINPQLRYLTAHDRVVRETVLVTPGIQALIEAITAAAAAYLAGPSAGPVSIALGCAGGRHRAATVGMALADSLTTRPDPLPVSLTHRDLGKPVVERLNALPGDNSRAALLTPRAYTHPDVLTKGVTEGWADPETDPTRIDWQGRQAAAAIPFRVVNGRPVNPCQKTGVRYGRNELGHWGEALAADTLISAVDQAGQRWIVMVQRADGHGWALPGGMVDPGETPAEAAARELAEETGLVLGPSANWRAREPQYVPDPRASDEAWMVTVLCTAHLGRVDPLPDVVGGGDASRAAWVRADSLDTLTAHLASTYQAQVFAAHIGMLTEALSAGNGLRARVADSEDHLQELGGLARLQHQHGDLP